MQMESIGQKVDSMVQVVESFFQQAESISQAIAPVWRKYAISGQRTAMAKMLVAKSATLATFMMLNFAELASPAPTGET